jgi:hypothetical protein
VIGDAEMQMMASAPARAYDFDSSGKNMSLADDRSYLVALDVH